MVCISHSGLSVAKNAKYIKYLAPIIYSSCRGTDSGHMLLSTKQFRLTQNADIITHITLYTHIQYAYTCTYTRKCTHLSIWALGRGRVHEDTTVEKSTMHVSHHRPNITSSHRRFPILGELALSHILSHTLIPVLGVALVDCKYIASCWDPYFWVSENKFSNRLRRGRGGGRGERERQYKLYSVHVSVRTT